MSSVAERLAEVMARIGDAARMADRSAEEIRLVAVSKRQPPERIRAAYDAGHRDFGENYVQGLVAHAELLPDDAVWHMIGHLQSNKAKRAAEYAAWIHTVDSVKVARGLAKGASGRSVLLQVNVAGEAGKAGVLPDAVEPLVLELSTFEGVQLRGFMLIPPNDGQSAAHYDALRELRDRVQASSGVPLPELSMGMSGDFAVAVACGATIVRVGTSIFGVRDVS